MAIQPKQIQKNKKKSCIFIIEMKCRHIIIVTYIPYMLMILYDAIFLHLTLFFMICELVLLFPFASCNCSLDSKMNVTFFWFAFVALSLSPDHDLFNSIYKATFLSPTSLSKPISRLSLNSIHGFIQLNTEFKTTDSFWNVSFYCLC